MCWNPQKDGFTMNCCRCCRAKPVNSIWCLLPCDWDFPRASHVYILESFRASCISGPAKISISVITIVFDGSPLHPGANTPSVLQTYHIHGELSLSICTVCLSSTCCYMTSSLELAAAPWLFPCGKPILERAVPFRQHFCMANVLLLFVYLFFFFSNFPKHPVEMW